MDDNFHTIWFMTARAFHFGACLLFLSVWVFDRMVIAELRTLWQRILRWLVCLSLPAAMISGIAWFAFVTIDMSGLPPHQALQRAVLRLVWSQTYFGAVWRWRSIFWSASAITAIWIFLVPNAGRLRSALVWLTILSGVLLLTSLAWAGHGHFGQSARWHLPADALHLVVAAFWPTGLLPLTLLLLGLRRTPTPDRWKALSLIVNRFSAMSLVCVALLAVTGTINGCYMLRSVSDLFSSLYGRVLLIKMVLFCLMVGIGAYNLLRLKPRISALDAPESQTTPAPVARLQITVGVELLLGVAVVLVVALLGLLMPPQM